MAQLKDLLVTGDSRVVGNSYNNTPKIAFGTCTTAAGTATKDVTISDPAWNLQVGDIVGVKFTNSNTAGTVKLNVNNSGAIQVSYNTTRPYTGTDQMITGYANRTILYQYDGTYWHWVFDTVNRNDNTYTTAKSWTAAATAAKTATCHDYVAAANSWNIVQMVYANTSATALTLNINGQGAKPIYINGSASSTTNYTLPAAHYLVYYDGTNYYFRTDGKLTGLGDLAYISKGSGSSKYLREDGTWQTVSSGGGTITGVSVNGTSVATSGVANITSVPASILSGAIANGVTATTQSSGDNSTKVATTAYVDAKPTILSGTSDPASNLGNNGDIYIKIAS